MPEHPESAPMRAARAATVNSCVTQLEEVLTAAPSNVWGSEKPTEEGFYPWRHEGYTDVYIALVKYVGDDLTAFCPKPVKIRDAHPSIEWGGKIAMPSEPVREP